VEIELYTFLTTALDGGDISALTWHPLDRRLGGPRASVDAVAKRKSPFPAPPRNKAPVVQPIA